MQENPEVPYRVITTSSLPEARAYMYEIDGKNYQMLDIGKIPDGYRILSGNEKDVITQLIETANMRPVFVEGNQKLLLPTDTMNLSYANFENEYVGQGETFGHKIERLYERIESQLGLPRTSIALSASSQIVVVLPFKTNE